MITIRAGHGPGVGAGHLGRTLALAEALLAAGHPVELADGPHGPVDHPWADRFRAAGVRIAPSDTATGPPMADLAVVDDYSVTQADLDELARTCGAVLLIDDHGESGVLTADWIVDQNLGADETTYAGRSRRGVLLGPSYALVRSEVAAAIRRPPPDRSSPPRRLLVATGGDPSSTTTRVVDAAVAQALDERADIAVVPMRGVTDVGALLATVDLAVSAAGTTCWDLCAHAVPAAVVSVAPNQALIARALGVAGAALDAGDLGPDGDDVGAAERLAAALQALLEDPVRRVLVGRAAGALVDGLGAARVVEAVLG